MAFKRSGGGRGVKRKRRGGVGVKWLVTPTHTHTEHACLLELFWKALDSLLDTHATLGSRLELRPACHICGFCGREMGENKRLMQINE